MEIVLIVVVLAYCVFASVMLTLWMASNSRMRDLERSVNRHPAGNKLTDVDDAIRWQKES